VIVRIATEGQYEVADGDLSSLDELDNEAVAACAAGDEPRFRAAFSGLLDYIRTHGHPVADDQLSGSDLILPPPDVSMAEAREEFTGDGLIPS
jgi:hypothetical protein